MRRCALLMCLAAGLWPASARAATFTVTSDADAAGNCAVGSPTCTLRQAVDDANAAPDLNDIAFALGAGRTIGIPNLPPAFPVITSPVRIDGTTQLGSPVELLVALGGLEFGGGSAGSELLGLTIDGEAQVGVHVLAGGGPVRITRNVIGLETVGDGFHNAAVLLDAAGSTVSGNVLSGARTDGAAAAVRVTATGSANTVAGNLIGLDRDGTTPWDATHAPAGVVVACGAGSTSIQGNVIGATSVAVAAGAAACPATSGLLVDGNLIGTAAPNEAGVVVRGSLPNATVSGNTIVGSRAGPGIRVGDAGAGVRITRNSISGNVGGIDLPGGANDPGDTDGTQNFPAVEAATSDGAATLSLTSKPNRDFALEVFASPACDLSGFGEGAGYLDTVSVRTDAAGFARVGVALPARPAGTVLTATATDAVTRDTSEFSACATVAPAPAVVTPAATPTPAPPPVLGKSVSVTPVMGPVRIKRPRARRFVPLTAGELIPVGSTVDATRGRVRLTSAADARGRLQTAELFAGQFKVTQAPSGLTELVLNGPLSCPRRATAAKRKPKRRDLWGDGKGRFRTRGRYGSAAIRGTRWLTSDRCDGTHFAVRQGVVRVRDFTRRRTAILSAGRRYLAPARR